MQDFPGARRGAWLGGVANDQVAKTANYTLVDSDHGKLFTNAGAGGAVIFTLPTAKAGTFFRFLRVAAQDVTVTATGGAKINGGSANGSHLLHGGTFPSALREALVYSDGTDWYVATSGPPLKIFVSAEQTGTGSSQNVAHGLGVTPTAVFVACTDDSPATAGVFTVTEGTHTSTNVVLTVTVNKKFKCLAFV